MLILNNLLNCDPNHKTAIISLKTNNEIQFSINKIEEKSIQFKKILKNNSSKSRLTSQPMSWIIIKG